MVSEERVAVITGAGSGINRATALRFADNGYRIGVLDFNMGGARETVGLIEGAGGHAHAAQVNVADRAAVFGAVDQIIGEWGRIDVLVNGAGHADFVPFLELTEESIDRMLDVHLKGTIMCTQAVVPHMRDRGYGRIVCISSVGAVSGVPKHSHYAAAKSGILGFARALCREIGPWGITINCVAPGAIDTPMVADIDPEARARIAVNPMGRTGTPEDVAAAIYFLASEEAEFITGAMLLSTGGNYT